MTVILCTQLKAPEQAELLVGTVLIIGVVFVTMLEELLFTVLAGVHECVLGSEESFVRVQFLWHLVSFVPEPCNPHGLWLDKYIPERVLGFALVIKFIPLWVSSIGGIINHSEQICHGEVESLGH